VQKAEVPIPRGVLDMTEALVVREAQELAPQTARGILTRDGLREAAEQRKLLSEYVNSQMIPKVDFGVIPGTPKPTLLKPGAEKIVDLFRCTPKFKLVRVIEDYDRNLFAYTFRVQLYQRDAEAVLAEGYGSANSREGRYRWRQANRKCPKCGKEAIIQGKAEYGGGWLCFKKKGGCGAKWDVGAKEIEGQDAGQIENEDVATLANTILKMAKKRALVDGAIALARVSDLFTQDVEDAGHAAVADDPGPQPDPPARVTVHDNDGEPTTDDKLAADLKASVNGSAGAKATADQFVAAIAALRAPEHKTNWETKHSAEIRALPWPERKRVLQALSQAGG
jgi:hypothetical protein